MKFKIFKNKENNANLNTNTNKKTQEKSTGRSMVEMLGVLAIIGVLSIGGIQGYTIAMRKYRANEVANLITKYASVVYTGFSSYMNDHLVEVDDLTGYMCQCSNSRAFSNECCPFDSSFGRGMHFINMGLGAFPNGISDIETYHVWQSSDAKRERVQVIIYFSDKELCKNVATVFDGYDAFDPIKTTDAPDVDGNGVHCDEGFLNKNIPVD